MTSLMTSLMTSQIIVDPFRQSRERISRFSHPAAAAAAAAPPPHTVPHTVRAPEAISWTVSGAVTVVAFVVRPIAIPDEGDH